jgi:hypothetical protein
VDHVGRKRTILFNIEPITGSMLGELGLEEKLLSGLESAEGRQRFADAHARANRPD